MRKTRDTEGRAVRGTKVEVTTHYQNNRPVEVTTLYPDGLHDGVGVTNNAQAAELTTLIYKIASLTRDEDMISLVATGSVSSQTAREMIRGLALIRGVEQKRYGT